MRPVVTLLLLMGVCAFAAGVVGFLLGRRHVVFLLEPLASRVPGEKHARFLADLWAHSASYFVGFVGGVVVIVRVWRSRGGSSAEEGGEARPRTTPTDADRGRP
jgi:hypothetical protein